MEQRFQGMKLSVSQNEIVNPLCIILVKNGSKGDRLLFRYPWKTSTKDTDKDQPRGASEPSPSPGSPGITPPLNQGYPARRSTVTQERVSRPGFIFRRDVNKSKSPETPERPRNPYAIRSDGEDDMEGEFAGEPSSSTASRKSNISMELSDKDLSNLLAVNTELSEQKFELKVNDVRFVGHPTLMQHPSMFRPMNTGVPQTSTKIFHVAFCLHAMASHSIVKCFYDLSKRLGIALRHEEYRCGYLSQEMKTIIDHLDEGCQQHEEEDEVEQNYFQHASDQIFKSSLAQLLKSVYDDVCATGFVKLRVNNWIQLSFCLPQKIHVIPFRDPSFLVEPEEIHRCLESIRPYHALLLLVDREELAASFPVDSSPSIPRLLQVYSPVKSLQVIAADADLTLGHVVEIASHLVYWAVATLIYPMCETNVYVIAPDAPIISPEMEETFLNSFPGLSLTQTLADFSLPMPLGERANPVLGGSYLQAQLVQLVSWLLQYRLLIQLHTYLYLLPYLDENGIHNSLSNGQDFFNMEVRPYEHEGDDVTVSDSYSVEENGVGIPIPSEAGLGILEGASTSAAAAAILPTTPEELPGDRVDGVRRKEKNAGELKEQGTDEEPSPATLKETLSQLNETARRAVETVKLDLGIADLKLFGRLSRYFNGEFHFEEIMYRENVRRSQLLLLVDKFREVLITSEREDSSINFFKVELW